MLTLVSIITQKIKSYYNYSADKLKEHIHAFKAQLNNKYEGYEMYGIKTYSNLYYYIIIQPICSLSIAIYFYTHQDLLGKFIKMLSIKTILIMTIVMLLVVKLLTFTQIYDKHIKQMHSYTRETCIHFFICLWNILSKQIEKVLTKRTRHKLHTDFEKLCILYNLIRKLFHLFISFIRQYYENNKNTIKSDIARICIKGLKILIMQAIKIVVYIIKLLPVVKEFIWELFEGLWYYLLLYKLFCYFGIRNFLKEMKEKINDSVKKMKVSY